MLEQFAIDLLKEKGLPDNLDPVLYAGMINEICDQVNDFINAKLLRSLNEKQLEEIHALATKDPPDHKALESFLAKNVPNRRAISAAALLEFKELYLGRFAH